MRRRVVVTGMGCISPVGNDVESAWKSVREARSGVATITHFDATSFPTRIAAEVKDFDLAKWFSPEEVASYETSGPVVRFGVAAALQAMRDSGLDPRKLADPSRFGVYLGSGEGTQDFKLLMSIVGESLDAEKKSNLARFSELAVQRLKAEVEHNQEPHVLASRIAGLFGAEGPSSNSLTACAASAQAIGEGTEMIRAGQTDVMIVGGSHSMIHPFGLSGFCLLSTLSQRNDDPTAASRPFDKERDGFVMGEGAAMLVIEEYESAKKRGARIYGEIRGYGVAADAYRITDIPPDGNGLSRAMQMALSDAKVNTDSIHYVNAHGTSTSANDKTETCALKSALGADAQHVPISSTKSMTGHLVAACGALEAMFCLRAIQDHTIPPTANYEYPDPECDLDYVPNAARELKATTVMTNNSGFGGQNISLILGKI